MVRLLKILDLRNEVNELLEKFPSGGQCFEPEYVGRRQAITVAVLVKINQGAYGPAWAKELMRLYE